MGLFTRFRDTQELDGQELDGQELDGQELDGQELDGQELDGQELDGQELDGQELDGQELDGQELDGQELDGQELDELTTMKKQLHTALATLDGRLSNPDDLPFNPDHLKSESAMQDAITRFLEVNPRLKKNYVAGDVGQGTRGSEKKPVDLIELMRNA